MLFNSLPFLIFFPVVTALFFALPHRWRWTLLLGASCWFYMAFRPLYILILAFTIAVDYVAARFIDAAEGRRRRWLLIASLVANVGVLVTFKYWDFLAQNVAVLSGWLHVRPPIGALEILLPIGLSFHTFQSMSYTIEVYRGRLKAERHFGIFSLYVMFYPQLVAGPIERPQNLLHQFYEEKHFDLDRVLEGLGRMLLGFFKKVVIADRVAIIVNQVYEHPSAYASQPSLAYVWATVLFAVQIYCDFSGYSDIALGSARVMGFRLMENFDRPYLSQSVGEFWRRWHISLSTWFKDYVYIPLGGSREGRWKLCRNLFVVFLISGLWHGANWTYVVWGALHGTYLAFSVLTEDLRTRFVAALGLDRFPRVQAVYRTALTFTLVTVAWVFFRANRLEDAIFILRQSASGVLYAATHFRAALHEHVFGVPPFWAADLLFAFALVLALFLAQLLRTKDTLIETLSAQPRWIRWSSYYAMLVLMVSAGVYGAQSFIYFQF